MSALASVLIIGISIFFAGSTHNLYVAPNGNGYSVYDDHDGTTSQVSRSLDAAGPLVVAANNKLWACWSEDNTIRRVIYCGYYNEQLGGWIYELMGTAAGDVIGLYVLDADRMVLNMHAADVDPAFCPSGIMWTLVPEATIWGTCAEKEFIPRERVYLPGLSR